MNSTLRKSLRLVVLTVILLSGPLADSQNNPPLQVVIYDSSATSGYIFLAPYVLSPPYTYDHPQMILDRYGNTVYYRVFLNGGIAATTADFKLQPNGLMSFFSPVLGKFYLMDSTFTVTDSVSAVNGYETDTHELQILSDGHYLILGRETRTMNLLAYRWFGSLYLSTKYKIEKINPALNEISIGTGFLQIANDHNGYSMWPMKYKIINI